MLNLNTTRRQEEGFTIVELLIVIVIIGILAAITIISYNGMTARAATAKRNADTQELYKAILAARINTGKTLGQIDNNYWSIGPCVPYPGANTNNVEPKDLPKTSSCWTNYYNDLAAIGAAAGMSLDNLRSGDSRGNPYALDENEGEQAAPNYCVLDKLFYFVGDGTANNLVAYTIPGFNC